MVKNQNIAVWENILRKNGYFYSKSTCFFITFITTKITNEKVLDMFSNTRN